MKFQKLFEPIKIGQVEIKNRYAEAANNFLNGSWTGFVDEEEIAAQVARAKGGTGLIFYGAVLTTEIGKRQQEHPYVYMTGIEHVPGLASVAEAVHISGAKIIMQILPCSSGGHRPISGEAPISVVGGLDYGFSRRPAFKSGRELVDKKLRGWIKQEFRTYPVTRAATVEELQTIIKETAHNAKLAVLAGYDGLELHTCHDYLLDMFRDAKYNTRTDKYGGSLENRNRFILEYVDAVIRSVKEEKPDFAVGVRVSSEKVDGFSFEDTKVLAKELEGLGIDFYHVTMDMPNPFPIMGPDEEDGAYLRWSKELKKILKVPVITPAIHEPELQERAVAEGWTDMVACCRTLIADPEFVNKVREDRLQDINKCSRCGHCWLGFVLTLPGRCSVNPEFGREKYNPEYQVRRGPKGSKVLPYILQ